MVSRICKTYGLNDREFHRNSEMEGDSTVTPKKVRSYSKFFHRNSEIIVFNGYISKKLRTK
jgi:hypothetical protein